MVDVGSRLGGAQGPTRAVHCDQNNLVPTPSLVFAAANPYWPALRPQFLELSTSLTNAIFPSRPLNGRRLSTTLRRIWTPRSELERKAEILIACKHDIHCCRSEARQHGDRAACSGVDARCRLPVVLLPLPGLQTHGVYIWAGR